MGSHGISAHMLAHFARQHFMKLQLHMMLHEWRHAATAEALDELRTGIWR